MDLFEEAIDDQAHVAFLRVEEEGQVRQFVGSHGADAACACAVSRGANDEEFFVKQGDQLEILLVHRKGDQREVKATLENPCDHLFGDANRDADLCLGEFFAQLTQWSTELVDQGGDPGGEFERADIPGQIIFELLLNVTHQLDDLPGMLGEALSGGRGDQAFAAADEEFGVEFVGKIVELKADGTRREMDALRSASHAGRVHDSQKELQLVNVHQWP